MNKERFPDKKSVEDQKENLRGADLSGCTFLSHADLRGAKLRDADLRGANLRCQNLDDLKSRGARIG